MSDRTKKWITGLLIFTFQAAVIVALLTRFISIRDTKDYDQLQPELKAPDVIATVLHKPDLRQIYVCYNDASYVNVYSDLAGCICEYLWSADTAV